MKGDMEELEDLAEEVDFTDGVRGRLAGRPGRDILTVTLVPIGASFSERC